MSSNTIFLKPGQIVNVDGVEFTREDIINNKIDSYILHKHQKEAQSSQ